MSFPYDAKVYSLLGEKKEAIDFLHGHIIDNKNSYYWDLLNNPYYDNLRQDSRFQNLLEMEKKKHHKLLNIYRGL